jgi:2-dehydropantoate 2-reductase
MTDLVVGGGAVGSLLAWCLAIGGRDVAIVRRRRKGPPVAAEVTAVDRNGSSRSARVMVVARPEDLVEAPELVVLAVKMFDLREAATTCSVWPKAIGLPVSNGVGAEEVVAAERPEAPLIAGSVTAAVELAEDGTVRRLNRGGLGLAPVRGDVNPIVGELIQVFAGSGLRARRHTDYRSMKWSKLLANLVGNASSAILDFPPEAIYAHRDLFQIERRQLLEALEVMAKLGLRPVALPGADARLLALGFRLPPALGQPILARVVGAARGGKDPSLRVHARSGAGPSEVDWMNGAVADAADGLGIAAPVNRRLTELVHEVIEDPGRRDWFRGRPDRLVATVNGSR